MESCVKNCGSLVHEEIATRTFMEELRDLLKHTSDENTKKKILEMLQTWGMAFRNSPRYRIVTVSHISDLLPNKHDLENKHDRGLDCLKRFNFV